MEELNKVPSSGTTFGNVVESINANFGLILTAITELEQTNKRKYLFSNEAELKATYPNPDKGDYAFVGELANAIVYKCNTAGTWDAGFSSNVLVTGKTIKRIYYGRT